MLKDSAWAKPWLSVHFWVLKCFKVTSLPCRRIYWCTQSPPSPVQDPSTPTAGHLPPKPSLLSLKAMPDTDFPRCVNTAEVLKLAPEHFSKSHLFFSAEARKWQTGCRIWLHNIRCCHDSRVIFIFFVTEQMAMVINLCLFWQWPGQNTSCSCKQSEERSTTTSCVHGYIFNHFFFNVMSLKYAYVPYLISNKAKRSNKCYYTG